ncbi:MAG: aminotransferase class V-fold PLP-dependent enzyme [Granulosicoccaceae bacterium]
MTGIDRDFVRHQFPAFSEPSLQGQAHFENAGGSYACQPVIDRLCNYYRRNKVQPYYAFESSRLAGDMMDAALVRLGEYLNLDANDVHLGPSTSQNTSMLAQAFRKVLKPGDEIIVTNQDHEANIGVWRKLGEEGIIIREWRIDPDSGQLNLDDLDNLFNDSTKLLAFCHCSNVIAHINPVAEICAKARAASVITVVDGVSYCGHGLPDVKALGADIYLFSLYKVYGPHQGVMTITPAVAELMGNQGHFFNKGVTHKQFLPAGPDHAQVAATTGVLEYFDQLAEHHQLDKHNRPRAVAKLLRDAELELLPPVLDFLEQRKNVRLLGPADANIRAATVSCVSRGQDADALAQALAQLGIMAGSGHFYGYRQIKALGEDPNRGALRLSFVHYTTGVEIDQLLEALDQVLT